LTEFGWNLDPTNSAEFSHLPCPALPFASNQAHFGDMVFKYGWIEGLPQGDGQMIDAVAAGAAVGATVAKVPVKSCICSGW
jgi:hypothetical protein